MNEYDFSDYSIFDDGMGKIDTLNACLEEIKAEITKCKERLSNPDVFLGPTAETSIKVLSNVEVKIAKLENAFSTIKNYLNVTSTDYQVSDQKASDTIV